MNKLQYKLNQEECAKSIAIVEKRLKNSQIPFTLDTCIFVYLARFGHNDLLQKIANAPHYVLLKSNIDEIRSFQKKKIFPEFIALLVNFMKKALENDRYKEIDTENFERELQRLVPLIPRRIVHDVMINLKDSYINQLISLYQNQLAQTEQLKREPINDNEFQRRLRALILATKAEKDKLDEALDNRFETRYIDLCNKLNINDAAIHSKGFESKYFAHIQIFKKEVLHNINKILKSNQIDRIILGLKKLGKKTYEEDIKFVAETIAKGAEGESRDSDVISLFVIHACKKVA